MSSFSTSFEVAKSADEVFESVRDVRGWWSGAIEGSTRDVGDEFTYEVPGIHWCRFRIAEAERPSRISWLVTDAWLTFTEQKDEWTGTVVRFDVTEHGGLTQLRFTHDGLVPELECYELCSGAWTGYIAGSLRHLVLTGLGSPNPETPVDPISPAVR